MPWQRRTPSAQSSGKKLAAALTAWATESADNRITGLDAYWLLYKAPAPGGRSAEITGREKLFTHSRGGHGGSAVPVIKAPLTR